MSRRTDVADVPAVLYGVEEAAVALRLSRSVLYELIRSGQLRTVKQAMDAANVRRDFRRALASVPGLKPEEWTPRELRHSFVSLLSDAGVPIEDVSRLVGHSSTSVTELVYRHQIRPVIQSGATIMDRLFGSSAHRRAAEALVPNKGVKNQGMPR